MIKATARWILKRKLRRLRRDIKNTDQELRAMRRFTTQLENHLVDLEHREDRDTRALGRLRAEQKPSIFTWWRTNVIGDDPEK